ncbi:MAG: hypothetical protein J6M54_01990 [Prevotella sp.]|nr:hypothetical protein [Prevotella sp.]MBR1525699.1 hypothetical protein [Prevotella sp.]MDY6229735.1 hypothetical protein [Prevotella sp.]
MKQLSKIQTIVFLVGGILMVIGAGSYVFMFQRAVMSVVFLVGALCFALMQLEQRYDGQNVVIIRLRRIQLIADVLFILSGILMIDSHYMLLKPLFSSYTDYIQYVYNKWIMTLLIAAILEIYTVHRLSSELEKEKKC